MILSQARDSFIDDLQVNSIYFPSIREVGLDAKAVYGNYETVHLIWCFEVGGEGGELEKLRFLFAFTFRCLVTP